MTRSRLERIALVESVTLILALIAVAILCAFGVDR
jgi:hypothetical protein